MFTGLVEGTGYVVNRLPSAGGSRLVADLASLAEGVRIGDSIAVNGEKGTGTKLGTVEKSAAV